MVNRLLLLNGIAIVNVILFHATGFGFTAMFSWAHRYRPVTSPNYDAVGSASYYALRGLEQYVAFTIPAFLFVSGFFVSVMAGRQQGGVKVAAVLARVRALAVPYLLWSAVILGALALEGRIYRPERYARMILTGSTHPNYYYVPLLMQLYLVAPALVWLARRQWRALLAATALLQLGVYLLQYLVVSGSDHWAATTLGRSSRSGCSPPTCSGSRSASSSASSSRRSRRWSSAGAGRWRLRGGPAGGGSSSSGSGCSGLAGTPWTENRATLVDGRMPGP